jgi:hypothetical protein
MSNTASYTHIKQIQDVIEDHMKIWPSKTLFIVLNKSFLEANCDDWSLTSICLHLKLKYKCLQWPKLVCNDNNDYKEKPILLIGYTN